MGDVSATCGGPSGLCNIYQRDITISTPPHDIFYSKQEVQAQSQGVTSPHLKAQIPHNEQGITQIMIAE